MRGRYLPFCGFIRTPRPACKNRGTLMPRGVAFPRSGSTSGSTSDSTSVSVSVPISDSDSTCGGGGGGSMKGPREGISVDVRGDPSMESDDSRPLSMDVRRGGGERSPRCVKTRGRLKTRSFKVI